MEGEEDRSKLAYEALCEETRRRENSLLIMGTIFVIASLSLLGEALKGGSKNQLFLATLGILSYWIWYLLYVKTSQKLDSIYYCRIREIEREELHICAYRYVHSKTRCKWWMKLRRMFWGVIGYLLLATYVCWSYYIWSCTWRVLRLTAAISIAIVIIDLGFHYLLEQKHQECKNKEDYDPSVK